VSQTKAELIKGLNINASAPATALQIDASGNVNIDSNTLYVDATNNRVGIGTSAPGSALDVASSGAGIKNVIHVRSSLDSISDGGAITFGNTTPATSQLAKIAAVFEGGTYQGSLRFYTNTDTEGANPSEKMRITRTGAVGIGTTSPAQRLHLREASATGVYTQWQNNSDASIGYLGLNSDGTVFSLETNQSLRFASGSGYTERARIDTSGRLLVGTSSAPVGGGAATFARLQIEGNSFASTGPGSIALRMGTAPTSIVAGNEIGQIAFAANNNGEFARIECYADATAGNNDHPGRLVFSTTADGASSPTERMRIGNGGKIYANTTADPVGPSDVIIHAARTSGNAFGATVTTSGFTCYTVSSVTNGYAMWMYNTTASANVGSILINTASVSYTTTSDYRLKENVTPVSDGISRLQQLKPSRFNFIADPSETVDGFIAHEVQTVVPEAITGTKDAVDDDGNPVYQGIDQSKLVPLLTAALQEAVAEIKALKDRVTALEAP
jgi:hypothetical protein